MVSEAAEAGARRWKACEVLGISLRTLQRWQRCPCKGDQRRGPKSKPANSLSDQEKRVIVSVANSYEFKDLSPAQIVPILADEGVYVASELSFYRVLSQKRLLAHRSRSKPARNSKPEEHVATGANQVWSWDITYLKSTIRGKFYYLYMVVDVWSRMIVGWEVHEEESAEHASTLITEASLRHGVDSDELVLHSDNGGPMKGATMLAMLHPAKYTLISDRSVTC
ncbi:MAG: DDE-type integrase/transposase/recombinase [Candidatus Krumholzibacteriales bacterium]